jgi:uncharacterized NAD-dependent epimerase/dehydratase family protein
LIRHSQRYRIVGVIDSETAGADAGTLLDGKARNIPIFPNVKSAVKGATPKPSLMVVGIAPTGFGRESAVIEAAVEALKYGLSIHSGLHLFLSDLPQICKAAIRKHLEVIDIRKPPLRRLVMFSGKIKSIKAPRLLVLGQDAAVGKRTASIRLCRELEGRGVRTCLIGTGQTAWLQGIEYGVRLDALPLDFAGGEIESEIVRAYEKEKPDLFIIEGQGSLLNPAYSCETMILLTACRPSMLVYISAPKRSRYIDFPTFGIRDATEEMNLLEAISGASIIGIVLHSSSSAEQPRAPREGIPIAVGADGNLGPFADKIINLL